MTAPTLHLTSIIDGRVLHWPDRVNGGAICGQRGHLSDVTQHDLDAYPFIRRRPVCSRCQKAVRDRCKAQP